MKFNALVSKVLPLAICKAFHCGYSICKWLAQTSASYLGAVGGQGMD